MKQRYKPMMAQSASGPFDSEDWIFEVKWDGMRAISYVNDELSIRSRNDKELKHNFPELEELKTLAKNVVIDGEIVIIRDGIVNFQTVVERSKLTFKRDIDYMMQEDPATYVVFDLLEKDGKTLTNLPLTERKRLLKETLKEGKHVILSVYVEKDGKSYYEEALKKGLEGVMGKKKDSHYSPGLRSENWLKIKKLLSCDCVIFGYTAGQGKRKTGFGALILGLYDKNKPVYVGKVGTGFSETTMRQLVEVFQQLKSPEPTLEQIDVTQKITWLKPKLVCETIYQVVTKDGRLRMPRFHGLRTDKKPLECTIEQLKKSGLAEYTSKRNFTATPEPSGGEQNIGPPIFVIQEHHARRLHYDLRLEKEGVLKSWAVPKGVPEEIGGKRLAVVTEDHPIEYATFEGTIPAGQYGAGTVKIWDKGTFEFKIWKETIIEFKLNGKRLQGRYILTKFKKPGDKDWLLLRVRD